MKSKKRVLLKYGSNHTKIENNLKIAIEVKNFMEQQGFEPMQAGDSKDPSYRLDVTDTMIRLPIFKKITNKNEEQ